jgi:guanylate kinase
VPDPPAGADVLLEIDVEGARQVLARCDDVVCILLLPPSEDDLRARLLGRGDAEARAHQRLELGRHEIEVGRQLAAHVIVNDDLERAVGELVTVIAGERSARAGDAT